MEKLVEKWEAVLESEVAVAKPMSRRESVAKMLEQQEKWCSHNAAIMNEFAVNESAVAGNVTGGVATWTPALIKMVRRVAPNLVSHDFMGVQPMNTPDGLIFAMRARYNGQDGKEAFYHEIDTGHSGDKAAVAGDPSGLPKDTIAVGSPLADPVFGRGMATADAEKLGAGKAWGKMSVTIEKAQVTAVSRGLFADYTNELRQDLMAVHGMDADAILSDILVQEVQAEMNREQIMTVNVSSMLGAQDCTKKGVFDLNADADGRWSLEKMKGLVFQLQKESNAIYKTTKRGRGNRVLVSANVGAALAMAGMLDFAPALAANADLMIDPAQSTFAGVLSTGQQVYIDPYAELDYATIVYKGESSLDAGWYYAPYTPLELARAIDPETMSPKMGLKTRYAIAANPLHRAASASTTGLESCTNTYGRKFAVTGL